MNMTYILIAFVAGIGITPEFYDEGACRLAANQISQASGGQATTICVEKGLDNANVAVPGPSAKIIRIEPRVSTPDPYAPRR